MLDVTDPANADLHRRHRLRRPVDPMLLERAGESRVPGGQRPPVGVLSATTTTSSPPTRTSSRSRPPVDQHRRRHQFTADTGQRHSAARARPGRSRGRRCSSVAPAPATRRRRPRRRRTRSPSSSAASARSPRRSRPSRPPAATRRSSSSTAPVGRLEAALGMLVEGNTPTLRCRAAHGRLRASSTSPYDEAACLADDRAPPGADRRSARSATRSPRVVLRRLGLRAPSTTARASSPSSTPTRSPRRTTPPSPPASATCRCTRWRCPTRSTTSATSPTTRAASASLEIENDELVEIGATSSTRAATTSGGSRCSSATAGVRRRQRPRLRPLHLPVHRTLIGQRSHNSRPRPERGAGLAEPVRGLPVLPHGEFVTRCPSGADNPRRRAPALREVPQAVHLGGRQCAGNITVSGPRGCSNSADSPRSITQADPTSA